eukprot:1634223-Prymnesium_polylepis.1
MNGHSGAAGAACTDQTSERRCVCLDVCVRLGGGLVRAGRATRPGRAMRDAALVGGQTRQHGAEWWGGAGRTIGDRHPRLWCAWG